MVESVVAQLPKHIGDAHFDLLTTYPTQDAQRLPRDASVDVVGLEPLRLALIEIPVAVLARLARFLRLPLGWVRTRASRAILDADVVVDVAGISFADGRGIPITVYNALMTGLPLLLGTPTVKAAQAMGPFRTQPNRLLAGIVLPHLSAICARGAKTRDHLNSLSLSHVVDVADLAFSLDEAAALPVHVQAQLDGINGEFIVVMPSAVVRKLFEKDGREYVSSMVELIRQLRESLGVSVVIAPHSYRQNQPEGRMNDGPVCREITAACSEIGGVIGIDADLTAGELRRLISRGQVLVTSRFHAMISGLATCTPTVVVGWSHKYREVLDDFGLVEFGMDSSELESPQNIVGKVVDAHSRRDALARQIAEQLPKVQERSLRNFTTIASVVQA
jgi:colanic acid/amylovoran biosynthesis protein